MSITATAISNTEIAQAFAVLENAGVINDDASCDLLSNWLHDQGTTIEQFNEAIDSSSTYPDISNPLSLSFSQEQLAELHDLVESETKHAYDAVAEGIFQATRDFARSLSPVYDAEGNVLEEDTPEWEEWAQEVDNLVWIENYQVQDFDAVAYRKKQLEARLATTN